MDDLDLGATIKGFSPGQKVFSRYLLKKILGRGGMGVVWLARDEELEREIALKFLPEIVALDPEAVTDLKRETRRNLELTHPHIVRIYDFVTDVRAAAISMEFVDGATLTALKLERPGRVFPLAELRPWLKELVDALHYAHTKPKIVHRDLKPANLMITKAGELKVTDFGIARGISDSVSRVSAQAGSSGTPVYMSPQQMMGERPAVSDDLYAFGATLYELLTGKPPFYSGNVILQVQTKTAPALAARREELGVTGEPIPPEWESTVAACLAKEPADRPKSIRAAAVALGLIEGRPVEVAAVAEPPPVAAPKPVAEAAPAAPAPRAKSGAPVVAIIAAVVVAAAVLGAAGWWYGVHRPEQRRIAEERRIEEENARLAREAAEQARVHRAIMNNLRQLGAASDQYFLENGVNRVQVAKLLGPEAYIRQLTPVAGESYLGIGTIEMGKPFTVTTAERARYTYTDGEISVDRSAVPSGNPVTTTAAAAGPPPVAGKAWENSLGMKFVPLADTRLLIAVWETRVQDFEVFVRESGQEWKRPSFPQGATHPAANVSWEQARAFCAWLTDRERAAKRIGAQQRYRLPTDAEWSQAVGLGVETGASPREKDGQVADVYPWGGTPGQNWPPPARVGNYPDESEARAASGEFFGTIIEGGYDDGFPFTSPVGAFPAINGLHDLSGNVWEWCEDLYEPGEVSRVLRGGSFTSQGFYLRYYLLSSYRNALPPEGGAEDAGFRVVLQVE